jgi:hypothetical protein
MIKLLTPIALLGLTACFPPAVMVPVGLVAGETGDRVANCIIGGTCGNTISGDTAIARTEGSKSAEGWCHLYDASGFLPVYDGARFALTHGKDAFRAFEAAGANDHCARWEMYESGKLDEAIAALPPHEAGPIAPTQKRRRP